MYQRSDFGDRSHLVVLQRLRFVAASVLAGLLACGALLAALGGPVPSALAAGPVTYPGSAPCDTTLQACLDGSLTGTTIVVQAGAYFTDGLTLSRPVSLTGVSSATVILNALADERVLTITGAAVDSSVIISGLTFAGGHAAGDSCPDGCGGAILITATAQPLLINLTITNSTADSSGGGLYADTGSSLVMSGVAVLSNTTATGGFNTIGGGGVYADGNAAISAGVFQGNLCTSNTFECKGGGLFVQGDLVMTGSQFLSNTNFSGYFGQGAGASVNGNVTLNGGVFQNNQCTGGTGACYGGGLWTSGNLAATNTQFLSNTSIGNGGGAYVSGATVNAGLFQNNQCNDGYGCAGGGLSVNGDVVLNSTQFLSNTSVGVGGGAYANGNVTLSGDTFENNQCTSPSYCYGGGLFTFGNLAMSNTQIMSNTSIVGGGGVSAGANATIDAGVFQNNQCTGDGCGGGGLSVNGALTMTSTQFLSNSSTGDGGGMSAGNGSEAINAGVFQDNQCTGTGCQGGGLSAAGDLVLSGTQFLSNTSVGSGGGVIAGGNSGAINAVVFQNNHCTGAGCWGGGLYATGGLFANVAVVLSGTQFLTNTSTGSGGGVYAFAGAKISAGVFQNNQCTDIGCSGGGLYSSNNLAVTSTLVLGNRAQQGAGIDLAYGDGRLVNDLFVANSASSGAGDALFLGSPLTVTVLHTTIASPTIGSGAAIVVVTGTVNLINNIIASDTTGIRQTAGSVFQDYNLFSGNGTNVAGTVSGGGNSFTSDPKFVDPLGGPSGYQLGASSLAVDAGTNAGVPRDFFGDLRPQGNGFDIGFDESPYSAFADLSVATSASASACEPCLPGRPLTYTLSYSNAGPNVAAGVRLTDIVPSNLISLSYTSSGAALTPVGLSDQAWQATKPAPGSAALALPGQNGYVWQVTNLAPGAGGVVTVTGVLSGGLHGAVLTQVVSIANANTDTTPVNDSSAVSVTVANVPPVAADDAYTVTGNTTLTVTAPAVLLNDSDANNDLLTTILAAGPLTGTLNLHADGSFTYTPPRGFAGVVTFTYRANDGLADSNTATVTITVFAYKLYLPVVLR